MKFRRLNYYGVDYSIEFVEHEGKLPDFDKTGKCVVSAKNKKEAAAKFSGKYTKRNVKGISFQIKKLEKIIGEE
ncbi:hypothetical protein [Fructobacillus cardui]|uniref:hypothetical protein n=1 Tax=Fructobacillus cardui TaxID=2893170 RepID=UPI00200B688F|nr:hypothetical protein [Fructobacillus cardui]MCK8628199.1 hypothetical protein [Fructobacillus cardui]